MNKLIKMFMSVFMMFVVISNAIPVRVNSGEYCGICEYVVQVSETLLENNKTITEIEHYLDMACGFLPESVQQNCVNIVNNYFPEIVEYLEKDLTPQMVCSELGLCSSNMEDEINKCLVCENLMETGEKYILDLVQGSNWENISIKLEKLCERLPGRENTICQMLVNAIPEVVMTEIQKFPADKICNMIKAC